MKSPLRFSSFRNENKKSRIDALNRRVVECERHKATIVSRIQKIKEKSVDLSPIEQQRQISTYLGEKSYDEWMMLYDTLISEAQIELETYTEQPREEKLSSRYSMVLAGAFTVCFIVILALFFLPGPIAVMTGNVVGEFFDIDDEISQTRTDDGNHRLLIERSFFSSDTYVEPIDPENPFTLTGKDKEGKETLEILITPSSTHGSFDTKVEIIDEWTGPAGYEATMRVLNEKPSGKAYFALTGETAIAIISSDGEQVIPEKIGVSTSFREDWERESGLLADIRNELDTLGVETRLEKAFVQGMIPKDKEVTHIYSYEHIPGSWATFQLHAPVSGKFLLFDPAGSWWDYSWDYRCNITLEEKRGINRIHEPIEISAGDLSTNCPEIIGATEKSIRVLDNETEISSQVDDWNATEDGINDSDHDIDANDEIIFLANVSADETKTFWIYFDYEENTSPSYSSDINVSFNTGNVNINNTYHRVTLDNSGVIDDIRSRLANEIDVTEDWYWNFFRTVDNWDIQDFAAGNWVYRFCGPVRCAIKMDGITGFVDTSAADTTYHVYASSPEIRSYKQWTMSANEGMQIGDELNVDGGYTFSATGSLPSWIETDTMDDSGNNERTDRAGAYSADSGWWAYRVNGPNTDAFAVVRKYVKNVATNASEVMHTNWYDSGSESAAGWEAGYNDGGDDFVSGNTYEIANFYFSDNASDADYSYAQEWYNKTIYALNLTVGGSEELSQLNATMDEPKNGTRKYRGEAFTMNGTVWCPYGDCGNVSAWSQYFSTVSPLETWTETTQADFESYNTSVNLSILGSDSVILQQTVGGVWFDDTWPSRISINLSEQNSTTLTDFQMNITLDTQSLISAGKMNANCSDLRFANWNGTELPHWVEKGCNTSATTVWVKTDLNADALAKIYAYYGNPSASSTSNIDDVMETGLLVEYWDDSSGSPGTYVTMTGTCTDTSLSHSWGTGTVSISDCPNNLINDVSLRWLGWIIPGGDGSHDFFSTHDDGSRLFIPANSSSIFNSWFDTGPIESSGSYSFNTTQSIRWEWYENGGGAVAQLGWTPPGGGKVYPIPSTNLRSRQYVEQAPLITTGNEENISYSNSGSYISSSYDTGSSGNTFQTIYWSAETPTETVMSVYVRSSDDNISWGTWLEEVNNTPIDTPSKRYVQYLVNMSSSNVSKTPTLHEMNIEYKFITQDWKNMGASEALIATNSYSCGNLTFATGNCSPSWSVTPQQLGTYAVRLFANTSKNPDLTAMPLNSTIDVFSRSYLIDLDASPSIQARGGNITFAVRLLDDLSEPLEGKTINFTDLTDVVNLGTNVTDVQGYAYLTVTINTTASFGDHTLSIEYAGNDSEFIEGDSETQNYRVSSTPIITDQKALPTTIGIRDSVTISANVSDAIGVHKVWVNVSRPDSTWDIYSMLGSGNDTYTLVFNDTWLTGMYTFKVSANNTDGIIFDPPGNFTVNASATLHIDPEFDEYKNFETVYLSSRRRDDWWNNSWLYRQSITVTSSSENLSEYQVNVTLDTQSLIAAGKMNNDCSDIRFTSSEDILIDYYIKSGCNTTTTTILVQVPSIPDNENAIIYPYYGNAIATSLSNYTAVMTYDSPQIIGYVVSNLLSSNGFTVFSLVDNNNISVGATTALLNRSESVAISGASISTPILATGPVMVEGIADGSDIIVPSTWAGTEFINSWRRDTDDFSFLSPWGTANVSIYDNGTLIDNFLVGSSGLFVDDTYDITNLLSMRIVSDIPILAYHSATTSDDAAAIYPATSEPLYGVPSRFLGVGTGPNGATVQQNQSSGGALSDLVLSADESYVSANLGGAKGVTAAYRLESSASNELIGAMQQADDDGTEITVFLPERVLGTLFGSNITTDHIAIAAPTLGTNCTVYNSAYVPIASALSTGNNLISKIGFGTGDDNTFASPGWTMECNNPVWVMYEKDGTEDESNMISIPQMQQYAYPEPNAITDNSTEESVNTGLENSGLTNLTGYLFLSVEENSTGSWSIVGAPVWQDITPRTIDPMTTLNISPIWDAAGSWLTSTRSPGWYRVYAAFRDNESNVLSDNNGVLLEDTGLFRIVEAQLQLNNLSHENEYENGINEYEAGDILDWLNITIQAKNNTAISASINLTLLNGSGLYPGWGPASEQSCGDIAEDAMCTRSWNNATAGYAIPLGVPSGSYSFTWRVNLISDNGPSEQNSSLNVLIHNTPSTFSSSFSPTRIFANGTGGTYTFNMTNLWSENLTGVTARVNIPQGVGLNAICIGGGTPTGDGACTLSQFGNGTAVSFSFNISANLTAVQGDYWINLTLNYTNPGGELRTWLEQEPQLLEVRQEGIIAITVTENPSTITRGQSSEIKAFVNNTGFDNSTNVFVNYTFPGYGWLNTTPLDLSIAQLNAYATAWHNLSFAVNQSASLGPMQILLDSGSDTGQSDFKYIDITIYANTSVTNTTMNDTNVSRGETVSISATLRYDNGTPIAGETVSFYDETDAVIIGDAVTNAQGVATRSWLIPGTASQGLHTINMSYAGSGLLYTLSSWNSTILDIGLKPVINSLWGQPNPQGQGSNVTIYANVTDDDIIQSVVVSITAPNGTTLINNAMMSYAGGLYSYLFNQTWNNGTYNFTVMATDSTTSKAIQDGTFVIENDAFLNINVSLYSFGQNENVTLQGHSSGWWWNGNWLYRRNLTVSEQDNLDLAEVQVNFTIDTATLVSSGKLNANCSDLRFILVSSYEEIEYYRESSCNQADTKIWIKLPELNASDNIVLHMYYGNSGATKGTNVSIENIFSGTHVVVSDSLAGNNMNLSGFYNDTTVCVDGGSCQVINRSDIITISGASLAANTTITSTKPVGSAFQLTGVGSPLTPVAWLGKNFTFPGIRGTQSLDIYSPYSVANVTLYDVGGVQGNVIVQPGQTGEINYNPADGVALRLVSNASVIVHYEDEVGNNDYMPLYPESNGLYGIESGSSNAAYREIACGKDNMNVTVYYDDGSVNNYPDCDAFDTIEMGGGTGGGAGDVSYVISNVSALGGIIGADGDGTEGIPYLPMETLDRYYVLPQPAEYISIIAREPSTFCELRSPSETVLGSITSTSYTPPRPQSVLRFTGSPIPAGSRVICDSDVWAYFEYYDQNTETTLLGAKTWRNRGPTLPAVAQGIEKTYGSVLSNGGLVDLRGSLVFTIENNVSGTWMHYATVLNDTDNGTIRTLAPGEFINLASLWNASPWNTGNSLAGEYRAYAELIAPDGHVIASTSSSLWDDSGFTITPPALIINLTAITIYDVTESLNKHIYSGNLSANSTNDSFILIGDHDYRIEFHVQNLDNSTPWDLSSVSVTHTNLNSSWTIDAAADIWYRNASDASDRLGGTWNGNITWNTSGNGGLVTNSSKVVFSYVLNLTNVTGGDYPVLFTIDDPLYLLTDNSVFSIILPETKAPGLFNAIYNLTANSIVRGENTTIYARWNETIGNATVAYNSSTPFIQNFSVTLPDPNPRNWTNHTIVTSTLWSLGRHVSKLFAADELGNRNNSLSYLNFTVWGIAQIADSSISATTINLSDNVTFTCELDDLTNNDVIVNYIVNFYNGTTLLGSNLTNSSGHASWTYQDQTPGIENLTCNITENASRFYQINGQNEGEFELTTLESILPYANSISANVTIAHKGDTVDLRAFWHDNFQLDRARLSTNASGSWLNITSLALTGSDDWANFSYVIPNNFAPGFLGWRQWGNDSSNNINFTPVQTLEVWGYAELESISLEPAFMFTTNTTNITCRVIDAINGSGIENYNVTFENGTAIIGWNLTNASGHAQFFYTDYSSGIESMRCSISDDATMMYNDTIPNNKTSDLTTGEGGDIVPPYIIGGNYGINDTVVKKGEPILIYGLWSEIINSSVVRYNITAPIIVYNVSAPYTNNWTNYSIQTNSSWSVGGHVAKLEATDLSNNTNSTAAYLNFNVTATSQITWIGPSGIFQPGSITPICRVTEEENGQPLEGYTVYFYNDTGGLIGTPTTDASGYANVTVDTSQLDGYYDFSCRIFSSPSTFYYIGSNFQDEEELLFDGEPPAITLVSPDNGNVTIATVINVSFIATDDYDSVMNCDVNVDGDITGVLATTGVQKDVEDSYGFGLHYWNVTCVDEAGNSNTSATWYFNVTSLDTTPPTMILSSPTDETFTNSSSVIFSYNATDEKGLDECTLYIDGSANQTDSAPVEGGDSFTVNGLSEQTHTWYVVCNDPSMNSVTSEVRNFTVDLTPPAAFSLLLPSNGNVSGDITPTMIWEEVTEQNFWNYTLQISLSPSFTSTLTTEYVTFIKNATNRTLLPLLLNKNYYWRVLASDRAGWVTASSQNFTYITDNQAPTVLLISPPNLDNDPDGNVTLVFQTNDNNISNCTLYTNLSGSWAPNQTRYDVLPSQHSSFTLSNLTTGTNLTFHWNVLCFDSLDYGAFAVSNWTIRIGSFNDSYDNQTIPTNATVNNTLPRTDKVIVPGPINLIANGLQQVNCTANVSDDNGGADILGATAVFFHSSVTVDDVDNNSNHYTNTSCGSCSQINSTSATCICGFNLAYWSLPGSWTCSLKGVDIEGNGTVGTGSGTVNPLQAVDVTPTLLNYGDVQGGIPSPEENVTVINLGNVPIDVDLWGYATTQGDNLAMSCLNGGNITIGAERFSTSQGTTYDLMTPLTGSLGAAPTASMSIPIRTGASNASLPLYWRLQSGSGALGECNGTIVFHAQIA